METKPGELTEVDFKKIIARRDARYDGRFFFGVRTTRIYCRVSCPARPKPENILIFRSPSEAERSGYRPCLRCRPDAAPGSSVFQGTGNTVARALRLIEAQAEDGIGEGMGIETLASRLGVTDRHLRRLFEEHLGASPIEIVITRRLHLAKRLVSETNRPLSEIALAVGFQSIRRFNDAFKKLFDRPPSEFRVAEKSGDAIELTLSLHEPYDWPTVLAYLGRHEAFGIERVSDSSYTRYVPRLAKKAERKFGVIEVRRPKNRGPLEVRLTDFELVEIRAVLNRLARLFDTRHNPAHLESIGRVKPGGVRVPGSFDGFEIAVSIVISQLISTVQAKAVLKKLIQRFGRVLEADTEVYAFPDPQDLASAAIEEVGMTRTKAGAIRELAKLVAAGDIDLTDSADFEVMRAKLLMIKGIGPWTVELIAMRCWADPNAFPKSDLIVLRAFDAGVYREADWQSSRAYLTHCLWRDFSNLPLSKGKKS